MKVLETSRLILREFVPRDANGLELVLSDPETMRFYPARLDRSEVEQWIARNLERYRRNGHGLWAMVLKSSGELVGDCGLTLQQVDGGNEVEIGYHVRRDLWGQGLATEAARACRDFGFARLPVERIISLIRPENLPSRRVAEKNGMRVWKQTVWRGLPHVVYAIDRGDTAVGRIGPHNDSSSLAGQTRAGEKPTSPKSSGKCGSANPGMPHTRSSNFKDCGLPFHDVSSCLRTKPAS